MMVVGRRVWFAVRQGYEVKRVAAATNKKKTFLVVSFSLNVRKFLKGQKSGN
jgi:hypothetical protein